MPTELAGVADRAGTVVRDQIGSMIDGARGAVADVERKAHDAVQAERTAAYEQADRVVESIRAVESELTALVRIISREADGLRAKVDRARMRAEGKAPTPTGSAPRGREAGGPQGLRPGLSAGPAPSGEAGSGASDARTRAEHPAEEILDEEPGATPPDAGASTQVGPAGSHGRAVDMAAGDDLAGTQAVMPDEEDAVIADEVEAVIAEEEEAAIAEEDEAAFAEEEPLPRVEDEEAIVAEEEEAAIAEEEPLPHVEDEEAIVAEDEQATQLEQPVAAGEAQVTHPEGEDEGTRPAGPAGLSAAAEGGGLEEDAKSSVAGKTDLELAELHKIATRRAKGTDEETSYWKALVTATVQEAAARPDFGKVAPDENVPGRRAKKARANALAPLASAREQALAASSEEGDR